MLEAERGLILHMSAAPGPLGPARVRIWFELHLLSGTDLGARADKGYSGSCAA